MVLVFNTGTDTDGIGCTDTESDLVQTVHP